MVIGKLLRNRKIKRNFDLWLKKYIDVAICYDFDGTLSPKNMQEYDFFNALQADYTSGSRLHELVKIILEKIAADAKYLSFPNAKLAK